MISICRIIFYALSDPTRQSIVKELAEKTVLNCKNFEFEVAKSTLSHHLKVLRESGLTQTRLSGTMAFVSLRREDLDARFPGLLDAILAPAQKKSRMPQLAVPVSLSPTSVRVRDLSPSRHHQFPPSKKAQ